MGLTYWNFPLNPDLAPSDFHLFEPFKKHLGGRYFRIYAELQRLSERRTNLFNPAWQKSRPVYCASSRQLFSRHSLKRTVFQINVWNPDWVPNLGCSGVAPEFPLELLQQFLSFASSMGIVKQEDGTITQHAKSFVSENFTMAR
ncbi:hypothetical protein AVEN_85792-1 [Araneus ventricosus]|uniref:Uncharacterized protein n=1 Tax=Araneus ventricosus TaxID=182803 RepID=A0A4Y2WFW9_ARAVE|nr:hypothetical protein AVEN_85792-1 [Araneus ventricosus]